MGTSRIHELTLTSDAALVVGETTLAVVITSENLDLPLSTSSRFGDAVGVSPIMRHLFATLERAAPSDLTILIEGESGVGKDVLARAIHERSARRNQPFVVADCSAFPDNLIESELFGHDRGAFTGANESRRGVFEEANGGTLFLDEIGELPLDLQPKLLRALEQRIIRPVGGRGGKPVDVRVVAATNRRLSEAARTGEFRSDLFYRLAVVKVTVPPLRERLEDVLPIARAMFRAKLRDAQADLPPDFASMLVAYHWPGNVRELRNVIDRHIALGERVGLLDSGQMAQLPGAEEHDPNDDLMTLSYHEARKLLLERFEEKYAPRLMARAEGNVSRAADLANIARPSLYRMLDRVGLLKR
jgi:transcriptional regulator with PAS, ATPase and Fis domain